MFVLSSNDKNVKFQINQSELDMAGKTHLVHIYLFQEEGGGKRFIVLYFFAFLYDV
jgi:hypothetical protein